MAEGRMLKKRIAKSKKVAGLKTDRTRTLYFMILPHLDVEGRIEADPNIIKGNVCPYINTMTLRSIAESLKDMEKVGLIVLYEVSGEHFLQYTRFSDFQNLQKSREAKSSIPAPAPELLQSDSGVDHREDKFNTIEVQVNNQDKGDTYPEDITVKDSPECKLPEAVDKISLGSFGLDLKISEEINRHFPSQTRKSRSTLTGLARQLADYGNRHSASDSDRITFLKEVVSELDKSIKPNINNPIAWFVNVCKMKKWYKPAGKLVG